MATFQKTNWEYKILSQLGFIGSGKLKAIIISPPTGEAMVSLAESISPLRLSEASRRYREEDIKKLVKI